MTDQTGLEVHEIATIYKKSASYVRTKFKELSPKPKEDFIEGTGPHGHKYYVKFVETALGKRPDAGLTPALRAIASNDRNPPSIPISGIGGDDERSPIIHVLCSRGKAFDSYTSLVKEMILSGKDLRIRCLTGTDFFNAFRPTGEAFAKRIQRKDSGRIKVLLLNPFGHGAKVRSAAEGEAAVHSSQFLRDALNSFDYVKDWRKRLRLDAKWVEDLPSSLLVWSDDIALWENYDLGRETNSHVGCIGRRAPLLVIDSKSPLHAMLRRGFDWIFDGPVKKTEVGTYSIDQIAKKIKTYHTQGTRT